MQLFRLLRSGLIICMELIWRLCYFDHKSIKWFTQQADLNGQKARWTEILQEYNAWLGYCKGWHNGIVDALSYMPKINSLLFKELTYELLSSLRGLCGNDIVYSQVLIYVKKRDFSHSNVGSGPSSSTFTWRQFTSIDECREQQKWKHFPIEDGYLLDKGWICVHKLGDT